MGDIQQIDCAMPWNEAVGCVFPTKRAAKDHCDISLFFYCIFLFPSRLHLFPPAHLLIVGWRQLNGQMHVSE